MPGKHKAVDAGAGSAAEGGRNEELSYFKTHTPPPNPDEAYFSHGGAPITGDVRLRVQRSVGLRNAALAAAVGGGGKGRAGAAVRMATRGEVDATRRRPSGHGVQAARIASSRLRSLHG